jgi:hypothetical protein
MRRPLLFALLVLAGTTVFNPARAQQAHPPAVTVNGNVSLPLAGQAARTHVADTLYTIGVYLNGSIAERARVQSADVAKAIRIEVTLVDDWRRPRVAFDWRRELIPRLGEDATAQLQGAFGSLRHADVVLIEYAPGRGTTIRINRNVLVSGVHHDLMAAFIDHWLGQRPVSEEMKRTLLGS